MRLLSVVCLGALLATRPLDAQSARETADSQRVLVEAALQRLLRAGEPRHVTHDEGQWLQNQVDAAVARGDQEIVALARRAATPLVAGISAPISSTASLPSLSLARPRVLLRPEPLAYDAHVLASVDGGEAVSVGTFARGGGGRIDGLLAREATRPGVHSIRLQARITFKENVPAEVRDLGEVHYALYDADSTLPIHDARAFLEAAAHVSAQRLDPQLPDLPLYHWLYGLIARQRGRWDPYDWHSVYCEDRVAEAGVPARSRDICATTWFQVGPTVGQLWIRTGRLETGGEADPSRGDGKESMTRSGASAAAQPRWLLEEPSFEGVRLRQGQTTDLEQLSSLSSVLGSGPAAWPIADISVAPEDVDITPGRGVVRIRATIRNTGANAVHGVHVTVDVPRTGDYAPRRDVVVSVPARGATDVDVTLSFPWTWGAVVVHAMQMGEHSPHDTWMFDPTPENSLAFRIVRPQQAPAGYREWLSQQCGPCRGF